MLRTELPIAGCRAIMPLMRQLILFLILLIAVYYVRRVLEREQSADQQQKTGPAPSGDNAASEQVLPCHACGVLVPESEGVHVGEHFYCSREHAGMGV